MHGSFRPCDVGAGAGEALPEADRVGRLQARDGEVRGDLDGERRGLIDPQADEERIRLNSYGPSVADNRNGEVFR